MINTNSLDKPQSSLAPHKFDGLDATKKAKLGKAVQEFESVFVGYLLKTMRATVPKSEVSGDDFGGDLLEGMFDMEMAKHISHNSGLGMGEMLYKQMTGESLPAVSHQGIQKGTSSTLQKTEMNPLKLSAIAKAHGSAPPSAALHRRMERLDEVIQDAARQHSLDANLLRAVIATESGARADSLSTKGAKGLMQLIDSTAADMGVKDVWNPRDNVFGGAKYLKEMLDRFDGDLTLALASYNAGPGAVEKHERCSSLQRDKGLHSKSAELRSSIFKRGEGRMTTIKELHEVITTEAELTEGLAEVLQQQQAAIIQSRADDLGVLIERSEELIQPIENLEKERARLSELVVCGAEGRATAGGTTVTSSELVSRMHDNDAQMIGAVIRRLREASREVLRINRLNAPLLEHSQYFIRQTLRAATDDYKKNLVDKRM